jgi:hypothetical protein
VDGGVACRKQIIACSSALLRQTSGFSELGRNPKGTLVEGHQWSNFFCKRALLN